MNKTKDFKQKVLALVLAIPRGQTLSYAEVALYAGHPGAARAVGSLMKANQNHKVPCHRVVRSDGTPGDYNAGSFSGKIRRLKAEGAFNKSGLLKHWKPTMTMVKKPSQGERAM